MLLDFIWGMGVARHLEGQSGVFCTPRSTWYEVRSQNPAICQGEFRELKSRCVLVFHISIKHVYKMPGSPKCLMNQGSLRSIGLLAAAWEWAPSLSGPHRRPVSTCGHSIDRGCSPFRPLVQQGTRASFLVLCPSLEQGTDAPQTHEMWVLQGEGLAQSFPCPTSET